MAATEQLDFLLPSTLDDDLFNDDFMKFLSDADFMPDVGPAEPATSVGSDCSSEQGQPTCADVSSRSEFTAPAGTLQGVQMHCAPVITTDNINFGFDVGAVAAPVPGLVTRGCSLRTSATNPSTSSAAETPTYRSSPSSQPSSSQPSTSDSEGQLTRKQIAANKRKAPEVDWRAIEDPAERRRQRRLAKNRVTAARSRERKKEQWGEMEIQMAELRTENLQMKAMMEALMRENTNLKEQLASLTRGASLTFAGNGPEPAVLWCLAIMHLVCRLPCVKLACMGLGLPFSFSLRSWQASEGSYVLGLSPCVTKSPVINWSLKQSDAAGAGLMAYYVNPEGLGEGWATCGVHTVNSVAENLVVHLTRKIIGGDGVDNRMVNNNTIWQHGSMLVHMVSCWVMFTRYRFLGIALCFCLSWHVQTILTLCSRS